MAIFSLQLDTPLPPDAVLARVLDLDLHTRLVPFTTLLWQPPLTVGSRFTARTRLGPWRFDDPMVVRGLRSTASGAAYVQFEKTGSRLGGSSEITIRELGGDSRVEWRQSLVVRGLASFLDPAVGAVARVFYRRMVTHLVGPPES